MKQVTNGMTLTDNEMYALVGERDSFLKDLVAFLREMYKPTEVFKYSQKEGWTVYYRRGGKPLCYIHLSDSGFTVTIVIGVSLAEKIATSGVSVNTLRMFSNAKQYYDGKWLFYDVVSLEQVRDIEKLLLVKKNPVKKLRKLTPSSSL